MRIAALVAVVLVLVPIPGLQAADIPAPTTTLAAETGNNTSASPVFFTQTDGNLGAGNISKVPIRSLLYPGATTKLFAHVEPWWGSSQHIDIGYSSQDPAQVHRQVVDMISRGLDGAAVDWYGPDSYEALGVKLMVTEAESHSAFKVFVEVDKGAVEWDSCFSTCSATTAVIQLFTRLAGDIFSSPAYFRIGGRPVLREFGMETLSQSVDWNAVQAQVPGNPLIIHRNLGGFGTAQSGGAFGWMEPKIVGNEPANYDGTDELYWFYSNAVATYPSMPAFGAVWKGFNDILAGWAPPGGRHIEQNCGQTWLHTFAAANQYYSASNQLPVMQLITWNDYEEGTELETGIDNCVTVAASLAGTQLRWTISGDPTAVDHYTVFISSDGNNLASLGDLPAGATAYDLSTLTIPAGNYGLYVKAVGKPSMRNQMSQAVTLSVASSTPPAAGGKNVTLIATPASAQVTRGQTAQFSLGLTETGASDPVALSCSNLPAGATCSFAPATVTPGASMTSVALTISTSAMTASRHHSFPLFAFWAPGALGMVMLPGALARRKRASSARTLRPAGLLILALVLLAQLACGGGGATPKAASVQSSSTTASTTATSASTTTSVSTTTSASTTYTVTVVAVSGSVSRTTTVNLTVQ
ncbi:MAG: hypothetical protein ACXVZI_04140 [Terriglobales bacterium]